MAWWLNCLEVPGHNAWLHAEIASSLNLNWQEKQSEVRRNSSKGTYLRIALQCLDNNDVVLLLESILQSSKEGIQKVKAARGFRGESSTGVFDVWMWIYRF